MAETVFYSDDSDPRPSSAPAPKRRGRPPKRPAAEVPLPTQEDARQQEEMRLQTRVLANATKFTPRARAIAKAKPPPQVRKVAFAVQKKKREEPETVPEKRPRGRPKGSSGWKKREALLEEERRRHSSSDV